MNKSKSDRIKLKKNLDFNFCFCFFLLAYFTRDNCVKYFQNEAFIYYIQNFELWFLEIIHKKNEQGFLF